MKWLTRNLKYPASAQQQKIEGRVVVSFIINKDGTTSDIKVTKSATPVLDREALRVIRMMPKWKAGEDHGKPCRTMMAIPVVFAL
jgi:protein TonB